MDRQPRYSVRLRPPALTLALMLGFGSVLVLAGLSPSTAQEAPANGTHAPHAAEAAYLAASDAAMAKMMKDMASKPTGDVDRDFVAAMVPHHQGAIDMALAVLRYGRNEQIKRLAQEIIVTQQQEIAAMRLAVGEPLPPAIPSPTEVEPRLPPGHPSLPHDKRSPT